MGDEFAAEAAPTVTKHNQEGNQPWADACSDLSANESSPLGEGYASQML